MSRRDQVNELVQDCAQDLFARVGGDPTLIVLVRYADEGGTRLALAHNCGEDEEAIGALRAMCDLALKDIEPPTQH